MGHYLSVRTARVMAIGLLLGLLSGCGDDDGGIFGGESALSCVATNDTPTGVEITNTCGDTIIVLANNGERLVIPPGDTHILTTVGGAFSLAACFSPAEPEFDGDSFFCA